jgi:DNA-binding response OmpR family regulator
MRDGISPHERRRSLMRASQSERPARVSAPFRRRVALVNAAGRGGDALERALALRGWAMSRVCLGRDLSPYRLWQSFDALVVVLTDQDLDTLEILMRLSAAPGRPPVVLLTRRARTSTYSTHSLRVLGVDRLITWPCTTEALAIAIDRTWREESDAIARPREVAS